MTTREWDSVETEEDLNAIFGPPPRSQPGGTYEDAVRAGFVDEPDEPNALVDLATMPEPVCALHAPPAEPVQWLVDDLFTRGDVGLLVGDGGSFKSTAALHIAAACAGGNKAFDRFHCQTTRVLIVSAEDPGSVIQMRLEAFVRGHEWDRELTLARVHYFALAGIQLKEGRWKRHLLDTALRLEVGLVVLDPFVDLSGLEEENSNSEAQTVMKFARLLARETGASVLFVHHAAKSKGVGGASDRTQARVRGASAIANTSRSTLFFEFTDAGVQVDHLKMTYAPKLPPFMLLRDIVSEPTNRAQWISARLATAKPADARLSKAEEFVLAQITMSPGELNSSALRRAAKGSGVWSQDVDRAVRELFASGLIFCENGSNKQKLWKPTGIVNVRRRDSTDRGNGSAESVEGLPGGLPEMPGRSAVSYGDRQTQTARSGLPNGPEEFDHSQADAFEDFGDFER